MEWMYGRRIGQDWRTLSTDMQTLESGIIIQGVGGWLMNDHPNIAALTIHDSIMTHRRHVELVQGAIAAQFARQGAHPTISIK